LAAGRRRYGHGSRERDGERNGPASPQRKARALPPSKTGPTRPHRPHPAAADLEIDVLRASGGAGGGVYGRESGPAYRPHLHGYRLNVAGNRPAGNRPHRRCRAPSMTAPRGLAALAAVLVLLTGCGAASAASSVGCRVTGQVPESDRRVGSEGEGGRGAVGLSASIGVRSASLPLWSTVTSTSPSRRVRPN
jgi:hypothetical protein